MKDLWTTVAWSSPQVTIVALAGLIMERVAARRGPRAGAWAAAASLVLIALVTPLAFCPLAAGWIWRDDSPMARSMAIAAHRPAPRAAGSPVLEGNLSRLNNRDSDTTRRFLALYPVEESSWALPAKTFLPARGHLIRRIHVLNAKSPQGHSSLPVIGRVITIATLGAVGLAAASLRGPTRSLADEKPLASETAKSPLAASAKATNADVATSAPFDLSLLPGHDMGFVAARPAAIFRIPGMRRYAEMLDAAIAGLLKRHGSAGVGFNVESIEQAVIGLNILPRDPKNKKPGRIMTGAFFLRSVLERDWLPVVNSVLKALDPKCSGLAPVEFEGRVYYTSASPPLGAHVSVYFPDRRTLVAGPEDAIRAMIKQAARHWTTFATGEDWNEASRGLYAIAINNVDDRCKFDLNPETPDEIKFESMIETSSRVVFGLDWRDVFAMKATATYDSDRAAERAVGTLQDLLVKAGPELEELQNSARSANRKEAEDFYRVVRAVLGECVIHQKGRSVALEGQKSNSQGFSLGSVPAAL